MPHSIKEKERGEGEERKGERGRGGREEESALSVCIRIFIRENYHFANV